MKRFTTTTVLLLLVYLISCSSGFKLKFQQPGLISLAGIKRVAVAPGTGLEQASIIEKKIVDNLKKISFFQLFDKETLDDSLWQHQLTYPQIFESDSLALVEIGGILNLDAMLFINLKTLELEFDAQGQEKIERMVWTGEYERDEFGEIIEDEDSSGVKTKRKKLKIKILDQGFQFRSAKIEVVFRMVDFQMGLAIGSWDKVEHYVDNTLIGIASHDLPSEEEIKEILIDQVVNDFIDEIAPQSITKKRPIETGFAKVDSGVVFAKNGQWNDALKTWEEFEENHPGNAKIYYNIGLAYEAQGDYTSAEVHYLKASLLDNKNKLYQKAINNIKDIWIEKGKSK